MLGSPRSSTLKCAGAHSSRHLSIDNTGHTIAQPVWSLTAGRSYRLSGRVSTPVTSDVFTNRPQIRWINSSGATTSTDAVKSYTAATSGWNLADAAQVVQQGPCELRFASWHRTPTRPSTSRR
jgi:hypothetical protein